MIILNEFTKLTGYNCSYASQILGKKILGYVHLVGEKLKYVTDDHQSRRKRN